MKLNRLYTCERSVFSGGAHRMYNVHALKNCVYLFATNWTWKQERQFSVVYCSLTYTFKRS